MSPYAPLASRSQNQNGNEDASGGWRHGHFLPLRLVRDERKDISVSFVLGGVHPVRFAPQRAGQATTLDTPRHTNAASSST